MNLRPRGAVAATLCALLLAGCTKGPAMTPDQAFDRLEADLTAVATAVATGGAERLPDGALGDVSRDTPCGGPVGTDRSSVVSTLAGFVASNEWDGDADAARARVLEVGDELGYQVHENDGDLGLWTDETGSDAFILSVRFHADGSVGVDGTTPCLAAPTS